MANKKIIYFVIALIVVLGGYFLYDRYYSKETIPGEVFIVDEPEVVTEYLDQSSLPPQLPDDLPIEKDAPILRNDRKIVNTVEAHETRAYISKLSLDKLLSDYKSYMEANGYKVSREINQPNLKSVIGTKDNRATYLSFSSSKNSITGDITVEIMWIGKPNQ